MDSDDQVDNPAKLRELGTQDPPGVKAKRRESLDCRDLLVGHRNGNSEAFGELVSRYRAPIYSYLVRSGIRESQRDDVFQEVFVKIHSSCARYDESLPLTPWVFTIVVNTVRSFYRKHSSEEFNSLDDASESGALRADIPIGSDFAQANQTRTWIEDQLTRLPLDQKEAIILCCIQNVDQAEAATMLQIPLGTLKTNLRRARLKLTEALQRRNLLIEREGAQ